MVLTMEAVAKTFRYLDDEEVAAQRKAKGCAEGTEEMNARLLTGGLCSHSIALLLAGCGGGDDDDLRAWMKEQARRVTGQDRTDPAMRLYEAFTYNADRSG